MLDIKYNGDTYHIKNNTEEFTIGEFEKVTSILLEDTEFYFDRWLKVIEFLGVPTDIVDDIDLDELSQLIKNIKVSDVKEMYIDKIIVDGYTYTSYNKDEMNKPRITGKVIKLVESIMISNPKECVGDIMSIFFKRDDLTNAEHYDKAHLKYKAKLFRENISSNVAIPYIMLVSERFMKNINSLLLNGDTIN